MIRKLSLALTALALTLGLVVAPAALAPPSAIQTAEASLGHWCVHSGDHQWNESSGIRYKQTFRSHWDEPWNGGYRHRHETNVQRQLFGSGTWTWIGYSTHTCN